MLHNILWTSNFPFQTSLHAVLIIDRKGKFNDLESSEPFIIQNTFLPIPLYRYGLNSLFLHVCILDLYYHLLFTIN